MYNFINSALSFWVFQYRQVDCLNKDEQGEISDKIRLQNVVHVINEITFQQTCYTILISYGN